MSESVLEAASISKRFVDTYALRNVSIEVRRGQVLGLVGENGAGKSTLINILSGVFGPDSGEIRIGGAAVAFRGPRDALERGIYAVHQELNLVPELSIVDNLFLGHEPMVGRYIALTDRKKMKAEASRILGELDLGEVSPDQKILSLGMGQRQLVEIAKALVHQSKILILDEPTASLTSSEVAKLFRIVDQLKTQGVGVIFISHKLDEVKKLCDRVTVLRDGEEITTREIGEVEIDDIVRAMVGRTLSAYFPSRSAVIGDEALRVEGICNDRLRDVNVNVRYGEVVGLAGLVGSGRTELARAIFGLDHVERGRVFLGGKLASVASAADAVSKGIAFITEDRKSEGLILSLSVEFNTTIAAVRLGSSRFISKTKLRNMAGQVVADLNVKPGDIDMQCRNLSGGNQQKVVIGKWLNCRANVFIFDEPTRGIDVGSKVEVYKLINKLAEAGSAILFISSEMEEIMGMSDRVYVMHDGSLTGEFQRAELNQEALMFAATGPRGDQEPRSGAIEGLA
jgi:ribose transport system ATP-binding protein